MNPTFWRGKRVLLTGHTGFKGTWLSLWLQQLGADVTGFSLAPTVTPNLFGITQMADEMHSVIADIRDIDAVNAVVTASRPDIVIHMAAQPLVLYSYEHPVETYSTNVMGVVNLFEAIRQSSHVKAVVNVTTDKCYENKEWVWGYRENEAMGGADPYSSSKGCSELISSAYRHSYFKSNGIALATARAGNVIGGGDWARDRLVPDILAAFEKQQPAVIRNPQAIRPWQHVLEPLSGYLTLAENLYTHGQQFASAWNFGPQSDDVRPVQWMVEHLAQQWGNGASWEQDKQFYPHEAGYLKLDISRASTLLDWQPNWNLTTSLNKIVDWHKAWTDKQEPRQLCLNQINEFSTLEGSKRAANLHH